MLRPLQLFFEKRHARRVSRDLLVWYYKVHTERPDLSRTTLYAEILSRRNGLDESGARAVLRRAEQTFDWHSDREIKFRDIALIVAFDEYQRAHATTTGFQTNVRRVVARFIPEDL
jgi:hypothetical protein